MSDSASPSLRWTLSAYLFLGAGTALLLAGVALRAAVPVFASLPLLVAPFASALSGPRRALRGDLVWQAVGAASDVRIVGRLQSSADQDLADVAMAFHRPANLAEVAPPTFVADRRTVRFDLRWSAPYPTIAVVEPPAMVWKDPLGLVERDVVGQRAPLSVDRYPPELLRLGAVRLDRVLGLPGETRSHRIGAAGSFFGVRDAVPSDPPRRINWKASARAGRLLANEYELDRTGDVLLLLDARPTRLGRAVDEVLLGAARAAALGIAESFAREKARVGFAVFGEFVEAFPLASGRGHRLRLREAIRALRPSAIAGPSERCAATLGRFFPPGITTLLISPLTGDAEPDLVPYLRRRGYPTIVLSPSPSSVPRAGAGLDPEDETLAVRIDRLERRQSLARVWTFAPVVDWDDFWSLGGFIRLLREPQRRRTA